MRTTSSGVLIASSCTLVQPTGCSDAPVSATSPSHWVARVLVPCAVIVSCVAHVAAVGLWRYTSLLLTPSIALATVLLWQTVSAGTRGAARASPPQSGGGTPNVCANLAAPAPPPNSTPTSFNKAPAYGSGQVQRVNGVAGGVGRVLRKLLTSTQTRLSQAVDHPAFLEGLRRRAAGGQLNQAGYSRGSAYGNLPGCDSASVASSGSSRAPSWRGRGRSNAGASAAEPRNSRWQPSMARIASGQHLAGMPDDSASTVSTSLMSRQQSVTTRGDRRPGDGAYDQVPLVPHAGHLAVDCLSNDVIAPGMEDIEQVITRTHLLQFGALLGESSAELALSQGAGAPYALGPSPASLLGPTDNPGQWAQGWEPLVAEVCAARGLHYRAWRRYLRNGLFMYMSRTVFDGVSPAQLAAFQFDCPHKLTWDESCTALTVIPPPGVCAPGEAPNPTLVADWQARCMAGAAWLYARTKFPGPMAQREYMYARRVWAKSDDGGCYMLSRVTPHPSPLTPGCRVVRVQDFISGTVIRESDAGSEGRMAAEMVTVYFENSCVAPGIMNLGVRKALWPMVQKMEGAVRQHMASAEGAAALTATTAALSSAVEGGAGGAAKPAAAGEAAGEPGPGGATPTLSRSNSLDGSQALPGARSWASMLDLGRRAGADSSPVPAPHAAPATATLATHLAPHRLQPTMSAPQLHPAGRLTGAAGPARPLSPVPMPLSRTPDRAPAPVKPLASRPLTSRPREFDIAPAVLRWMPGGLAGRSPRGPVWQALAVVIACVSAVVRWITWVLGLVGLQQRLWRLERTGILPARTPVSHPVDLMVEGAGGDKLRGRARRWGRRLAARLALVAVRVVTVPLAHAMLAQRSPSPGGVPSYGGANAPLSPPGQPPVSRPDSVTSSTGGAGTTRGVHAGRSGPGLTERELGAASARASAARVMRWLGDPGAPPDYLLGQHPELLGSYTSVQQAARRQAGGVSGGDERRSPGATRLGPRPSLGAVVDGVALVMDRPAPGQQLRSPALPPLAVPPGRSRSTGTGTRGAGGPKAHSGTAGRGGGTGDVRSPTDARFLAGFGLE